MRNLRNFETTDEYNGKKCLLENNTVSYVKENELTILGGAKSYFTATYNVTSTTSVTRILGSNFPISQVSKMYIDDVEVTPTYTYTFNTNGEHVVKCEFCELTNCICLFSNCSGLTSIDLSSLDTSNVTNMISMFYNCQSLTSIDLNGLDTSNVTNMTCMFYGCRGLTSLDLSSFDTSKVTDMSWMFFSCTSLTSLDLSSFDTSNVTNMRDMFNGCSLTSLDLRTLKTSNVTNMTCMFYGCRGLTSLDLSSFDTSNVTDMSYMFYYCISLISLTITSDISKVTSYSRMFDEITTNGELIYNCKYEDAWNNILVTNQLESRFPSTWTKTCVTV